MATLRRAAPRRMAAIGLTVVLVTGCGARWSDAQRAEVVARGAGKGTTSAVGAASPSAGSTSSTGAGQVATGSGGTGATSGATGAGGTADQPGAAGGAAASGPLPCAAASDAPGVTADSITVAEIASITGPVPGLGTTAQAAVRAYVAHRNAAGGVCGRQIKLLTADDGTDGGQFRALVSDFSTRALGLAGNFAPTDGGGADVINAAQMPVVSSVGDVAVLKGPSVFNINPPPADVHAAIGHYKYLYDQGVRTAAVATLSADAAIAELDKRQAQIEAGGIQVISRQILPISTLSYDSAARAVANSGADFLFFLAAAQQDAGMAQSMHDSGYTLKFQEYLTGYGSNYTDLAGAAAVGTSSWIRMLPIEEAGGNAEQVAFLQSLDQIAPGTTPDVFATDAWASAKAFFDALEQLPGPITRAALVEQLHTMTAYDAAGMIGNINLGGGTSNGCEIGMRYEADGWRRMTPSQGFLC